MDNRDIRPKFEVEKLEGKWTRTVLRMPTKEEADEGITGFISEEQEVDAGYMVYLPSGSSIHVKDEATLARLGFDQDVALIDMETGDEVGSTGSLKRRSEQKTNRSRTTHSSVTTANGG